MTFLLKINKQTAIFVWFLCSFGNIDVVFIKIKIYNVVNKSFYERC